VSTSESNELWLACRLDRGMFSDEVAVTYPASEHWQKSVFVPLNFVRHSTSDHGEVRVQVLIKDGKRYAVLPSSQRDIVRIEESDLRR
jgi:hypothetical protein